MITVASPDTQIRTPETAATTTTTTTTTTIFRSRLPDIPDIPNHLPLHAYCFQNLSSFSSSPCLISASTSASYSYADVHLLCRKTAAFLSSRCNISKGDVVMILLQNSPEFVFTFLAASMLGAITTTANPFYTPSEISKQLAASKAKLVVTQSLYVDKIPKNNNNNNNQDFRIITIDDSPPPEGCISFSEVHSADEDGVPVDTSIDPDDAVAMPFSSGTTGLPKGVVLTHRSLISSVAQQVDGENPNLYLKAGDDVMLCVLPMFHIFSLNSVLLCGLRAGAAVVVMAKFEMERMLEVIEKWRVTVAAVVPPLVVALAKSPVVEKYDLGSVRIVLSGAAPLGKELEAALSGRVPQAVIGQVN